MTCRWIVLAIVTPLLLISCARHTFRLTEDAAMDRLMSTKHVAAIAHQVPNRRVVCRVDDKTPEAIDLYLGDNYSDHTTRIGFYRVTRDGRVWVNEDDTGLEERWAVIE